MSVGEILLIVGIWLVVMLAIGYMIGTGMDRMGK